MTRTRRQVLVTLTITSLLALTACGGDDNDSDDGAGSGGTPRSSSSDPSGSPDAGDGAATPASVWVTSADSGEVFDIDPTAGAVAATVAATDLYPSDVETGFGAVWVLTGYGDLLRIDPDTGESTPVDVPDLPQGLVIGDDAVYVSTGDGDLVAVDPASGEVGDPVELGDDVLLDPMVWLDGTIVAVNDYDSSLVVVDPDAGVTSTTPRDDVVFRGVADDGAAWFGGFGGVAAYDTSGAELQSFPSDVEVTAVAADPDSDAMWVGFPDGSVATLDAASGTYGTPVPVGDGYVGDLVYADGSLWAAVEGGSLYQLDPASLETVTEVPLPTAAGSAAVATYAAS
jgi:hypothetical protein